MQPYAGPRVRFRRPISGLVGRQGVLSCAGCQPRAEGRTLLSAATFGSAYDASRSSEGPPLIAGGAWCILFGLCWPLALLVRVLWPLVWLLALPFRLVGITFTALFAFLQALLFLPARLLGWRPQARHVAAA